MINGAGLRPTIPRGAILVALFSISLAVRWGAAELMLRRVREQLPDTELYQAYADSLLQGGPYGAGGDRAQRTPGYPAFLAGVRLLFGDGDRPLLYTQAILGAGTSLLAYAAARIFEIWGLPIGTAEASLLFCALDPYGVAMTSLLLSETLFCFLLTATALVGLVVERRAERGVPVGFPAALLGLLAGSAAMVRPSALLLAPASLAWWRLLGGTTVPWGRVVASASLGFLLLWVPWWVRNASIYGAFVPTTLNVGESLYDGLRPDADGASDTSFARDEQVRRQSELERNRIWRDRALEFLKGNPYRSLELAVIKLWRFWSPWPNESRYRGWPVVAATTGYSLSVYALAAAGVLRFRRRIGFVAFCLAGPAYFCSLHVVFVSSVRYRAPVAPFLAMLAGAAAAWLIALAPQRRRGTSTSPGVGRI